METWGSSRWGVDSEAWDRLREGRGVKRVTSCHMTYETRWYDVIWFVTLIMSHYVISFHTTSVNVILCHIPHVGASLIEGMWVAASLSTLCSVLMVSGEWMSCVTCCSRWVLHWPLYDVSPMIAYAILLRSYIKMSGR